MLIVLEQNVNAFLVPHSVSPIKTQSLLRYRTSSITPKPASWHAQSRLIAPSADASEEEKRSRHQLWTVLSPFVLPVPDSASPILALALSNQWQVNLIKHVVTLVSIRFVISTIMRYKRHSPFQWRNLPRYLLAAGLVSAGGIWMDSLFVIPFYGINLIKHAVGMWTVAKIISFTFSRRKTSKTPMQAMEQSESAPKVVLPLPEAVPLPPPIVIQQTDGIEPPKEETVEEEKEEELVVVEEEKEEELLLVVEEEISVVDEQDEVTVAEEEGDKQDKESAQKEMLFEDSLKDWVYSLANIQEELAELQLKQIPEFFSKETYDRAQERITNFQMGKLQDFFGGDEDEDQ